MIYWERYALGLVVVALLLAGLSLLGQGLRTLRHTSGTRLIEVLESTMLSPHVTMHVVRVGSRYLLVGAGRDTATRLCEILAEDIKSV